MILTSIDNKKTDESRRYFCDCFIVLDREVPKSWQEFISVLKEWHYKAAESAKEYLAKEGCTHYAFDEYNNFFRIDVYGWKQ